MTSFLERRFWPPYREVVVEIIRPHSEERRAWYGCPDCWAKIKPGPPSKLVADYDPTGLQGREGDS